MPQIIASILCAGRPNRIVEGQPVRRMAEGQSSGISGATATATASTLEREGRRSRWQGRQLDSDSADK
jgi:hypothetical protein